MAASKRKFYKQVITVTVLSETPIDFADLSNVSYMITDGDCSGQVQYGGWETVDGPTMARLLQEQGSDSEFFQLTEDGEDLDEDDLESEEGGDVTNISDHLSRFFEWEINNERYGGDSPATLRSAKDSLIQCPDDTLAEVLKAEKVILQQRVPPHVLHIMLMAEIDHLINLHQEDTFLYHFFEKEETSAPIQLLKENVQMLKDPVRMLKKPGEGTAYRGFVEISGLICNFYAVTLQGEDTGHYIIYCDDNTKEWAERFDHKPSKEEIEVANENP